MMESQKIIKCHRIPFMAEAKHFNIKAVIKIPAYAGMTTCTFCEFVNYDLDTIKYIRISAKFLFCKDAEL
jgi:hypothetical protein